MSKHLAALLLATGCAAGAAPPHEPPPSPPSAAAVPRAEPEEPADEVGEAPPEPALGVQGAAEALPELVIEPTDADVAAAFADAEAGKLPAALRRLTAALARIDRDAALQDRMLAHALMGRGFDASRNRKRAAEEYRKVIEAWAIPKDAMKQIIGPASDEETGRRAVGQALTAVGEALHFEAEQKRRATEALKPPRYLGGDVNRYTKDKIVPWLRKKRALLEEANAAYRKVLDLRPAPPPRWVIASAAHVGAMLESFVADFDAMPVPAALRGKPELLAKYKEVLSDMLEPQRHQALAAHRMCQSFGERFRIEDENTRYCQQRLKVLATGP